MATAVHPGSAVAASLNGRASTSWSGLASGVLDLLREAVLVLGRDARLLGSNRVADALLREGDGLVLSAGGVVASTPGATHALYRRIERAACGEGGRVQVPRFGRTPLTLLVAPHPQAASGSAAAVVFATDAAARGPRDEVLAARHGLTPTECCVAQRLCAGADVECIARELEISRNTVRGHLKQIFGKTRSHRQAELVCKLLSED
jgi:DNA-binding CsgD family transcriptional regulator